MRTGATEAEQSTALAKRLHRELKAKEKADRKAEAKLSKPAAAAAAGPPLFLPREWAEVEGLEKLEIEGRKTSILTWNVSARRLPRVPGPGERGLGGWQITAELQDDEYFHC